MENLLTVKQAAKKLSCHVAFVRKLIKCGSLTGIKLGKKNLRVRPEDVERLTQGAKK
jgi:excisionase family DNA binding protein